MNLEAFRGKVALVVNTASRCSFTPQYAQLEKLQQAFHAKGFYVLGFPCNQFGGQEPEDAQAIGQFCRKNYGVSFPMFDKVEVKGAGAHPLYQWLSAEAPGILGTRAVKWNFTKFLIGRDGRALKRYGSWTRPSAFAADIANLLA